MSDMKCPFCKTGNVKEYIDPPYYVCDNQYCPSYDETDTSEYDMLITTRKALDVAVDALKECLSNVNNSMALDAVRFYCVRNTANKALEQITALEQKNHFANASKKVEQKDVK